MDPALNGEPAASGGSALATDRALDLWSPRPRGTSDESIPAMGGVERTAVGAAARWSLADAFATEAAFDAWYAALLPRVHGYLFARCGRDPDLAEDLTQATFIAAVRSRRSFDGRSEPFTWLCGIARHQLADHFRRLDRDERRDQRLAQEAVRRGDPAGWAAAEERDAIGRALATLPPLQRAALLFTTLDGLTVKEAAALLERSEAATESLVHRARVAFRAAWEHEERTDA
jgi:RNA polymerase sigma-70 factor, ECF subfamily